jgi:hypothetical protein
VLRFANPTFLDFDEAEDDELTKEIRANYDFIRNKLIAQGLEALTGKEGKWMHARTRGSGHGSVIRAFFARILDF